VGHPETARDLGRPQLVTVDDRDEVDQRTAFERRELVQGGDGATSDDPEA
jgi:hypothetical protein